MHSLLRLPLRLIRQRIILVTDGRVIFDEGIMLSKLHQRVNVMGVVHFLLRLRPQPRDGGVLGQLRGGLRLLKVDNLLEVLHTLHQLLVRRLHRLLSRDRVRVRRPYM